MIAAIRLTTEDCQELIRILAEPPDSESYCWGPSYEFERRLRRELSDKIRSALARSDKP